MAAQGYTVTASFYHTINCKHDDFSLRNSRMVLLYVLVALLPAFPYALIWVAGRDIAAILTLMCYAPLVHLLGRRGHRLGLRGIVVLATVHSMALTFIAAGWVWSFRDLSPIIPFCVALIASPYLSAIFAIARFTATNFFSVLIAPFLVAAILAGSETLRAISPDLFMPLGVSAFGAATPVLLPISGIGGIPLLSLFVLSVNAALSLFLAAHHRAAFLSLGALVVLLVAATVVAPPPASEDQKVSALIETGTLCAYSDKQRRDLPGSGYTAQNDIMALVDAASAEGCRLIVFPEVTSIALRGAVDPAEPHGPETVMGVRIADGIEGDSPLIETNSTNSVCAVEFEEGAILCRERVDKRYLTPFVETQLFHRLPTLRPFGAWLTNAVTGSGNLDTVERAGTVLGLKNGSRIGVAVCLELFIPLQQPRDSEGIHTDVPLIVAPTDHSFFPPWAWMRTVKRRAAGLQAAATGTPVLVVSTEDVAFMASDGRAIAPETVKGDLHVWHL